MATLIDTRKEWLEQPGESFMDYLTRMDTVFDQIYDNTPDLVFTYPVADGKACYYIKSEKPLKLEHIPVGDAYRLPGAHVKGLRMSDVERGRNMRKLFSR